MIDEATLQHFMLGMMMALSYPTFKRFKYPYLGLILIHPFLIEGVQFFMPNRTPDTADVGVRVFGCCCPVAGEALWRWMKLGFFG